MPNYYDIGDVVRSSTVFTDAAGTAQDPTAVTVSVRTPANVKTTYTYGVDASVVKDSTGHYHIDIAATLEGLWWTRWASTGTGAAAEESLFRVDPSEFD